MQWQQQSDGCLATRQGGIDLTFDPYARKLRITVVDYHAFPLEVPLDQLTGFSPSPVSEPPSSSQTIRKLGPWAALWVGIAWVGAFALAHLVATSTSRRSVRSVR